MKSWISLNDTLNSIKLNRRKLLTTTLRLAELAFGVFFILRLKVASEPVSKSHGVTLRYALIAINNKLYNYDFGRETNVHTPIPSLGYKIFVRFYLSALTRDALTQTPIPLLRNTARFSHLRTPLYDRSTQHYTK